ncbi:unnamed protein product, partial [Laminaria digitata]
SHSGHSSSLPTTVRAFIFIARRVQHFLPSSTRVEVCLPTLFGAIGSWCLSRKKPCACTGIRTPDIPTLVAFEVSTRLPGRPAYTQYTRSIIRTGARNDLRIP